MDKRRSLLNVGVSIFFKIVLLVGSILVRRFLIQHIGNEVNGLNSLYVSIIGVLSVAELGVGSAITFCMYKPIVENDDAKVAALYQLFTKTYYFIGAAIFSAGLLVMPFLPLLAKDYTSLDVNLYLTFLLMLASVVLTYLFSAKTSLINAYKDNYITTIITSCGMILQYILQIVVLIMTKSFVWYLGCCIIAALVQWVVTDKIARTRYGNIVAHAKQKLNPETKTLVLKNVKAMFMHKIGSVLVNAADSIIISMFVGVGMLGKYSNYTVVVTSMTSVLMLLFTPLTAIIGHLYVSEAEKTKNYYHFLHTLNFIVGVVFFLGYYSVIDNLVLLLFGADLEVAKSISFVITLNYFIQFMRQATLLFRDATGTFYNDRWKPLLEGLLNAVLSVALVLLLTEWFGEDLGVVGVIVATIITNLIICHVVEPYVLYRYAFHTSAKKHYSKNYLYILLFAILLTVTHFCMQSFTNVWLEFLVNGCISVGISSVVTIPTILLDKNFKEHVKTFLIKSVMKK